MATWYAQLVETNRIPDWLTRAVVRVMLKDGIRHLNRLSPEEHCENKRDLIQRMRRSPIAVRTEETRQHHYELPTQFFQFILGKRLKYSCCYWPSNVDGLDGAEEAMLDLTCRRAGIEDGMSILDMGCGWGSFCVWIAERYPGCRVVGVTNSRPQREYVEKLCRQRDLTNVEIVTADVAEFDTPRRFDRALGIEVFEHMRNYEQMLARIADFLNSGGQLMVQIFTHREFATEFDSQGPEGWIVQHFLPGAMLASDDLMLRFQRHLNVIDHWRVSGLQYGRTLRAWLDNLDHHQDQVRDILAQVYSPEESTRWLAYWRLFYLVGEETWNLDGGREYIVSQYLFEKP